MSVFTLMQLNHMTTGGYIGCLGPKEEFLASKSTTCFKSPRYPHTNANEHSCQSFQPFGSDILMTNIPGSQAVSRLLKHQILRPNAFVVMQNNGQ